VQYTIDTTLIWFLNFAIISLPQNSVRSYVALIKNNQKYWWKIMFIHEYSG